MASKIILLNTEQNESIYLRDEMFYTLLAANKAKSILNQ